MNIGNPDEFTMLELAEVVLEVTGSDSELVYEPLPVDDPKQRRPDITLARSTCSAGSRRSSLREGLEHTAAWYRTELLARPGPPLRPVGADEGPFDLLMASADRPTS